MHSHFTAVLDACVLYPVTLRNVLLQLASSGLYRARWTATIRREWTSSLRRDRPDITSEQISRMCRQMEAAVPDSVVTGYESIIGSLELPDEDDRHVLAAAIRCHAAVIVTTNLKDFPPASLASFDIAPQHPDEFITHLIDLDAGGVCLAIRTIRERLRTPPRTARELLDLLQRQGLPETVSLLREFEELL